jgi:hypothetical protein
MPLYYMKAVDSASDWQTGDQNETTLMTLTNPKIPSKPLHCGRAGEAPEYERFKDRAFRQNWILREEFEVRRTLSFSTAAELIWVLFRR